ncbi:hypothetical protein BU16DRAFT_447910 [Lophium mytilinum]|uniref:C2H2-type domain-containing protein n=1 Tax=Lophium mytilinum TaxID=390894 RepID=A0A6A6RE51_9PEZI|nr:hypothetical protein BU16DRAFT_447910 [Lophium mytilinum]
MARKPKSTFKCDIEGCTSNALFGRLADLQRHQTTVHSEDKPFPCTVHRCSRVGPRGFNRRDHLTEHLRSYHQQNIPKRSPGQRSAPQGFMGN